MFRRMTVALVLAVCAATAFALPKPSEVKAAVASGNYAKAESMLLEVMKEKPSARAHYDLGQVYTYEGKHKDALNEYRQAQALDPSLKFASSAAEFTKKLATAQTLVAPPPVVVAQAPAPQVFMPTLPVASAPVQHESSGSGGTILAVLLVLLVGGGVAAYFLTRKKTQDDLTQKTNVSKERMSALLDFSKKLEDSILIAKTATYSDFMKRQILDRIAGLQTQVRNALADLKDGKEVTASRLATIETNVELAVDQAANGIHEVAAPAPAPEVASPTTSAWRDAPKPMFTSPAPTPTYTRAPSPAVVHHHHYDPAPAPVVVNNSGTDMLTGILIGEALSRPTHERTVYVDRTPAPRQVQEDSYEAPAPAPAPRYSAPAPTPVATFDSNDDDKDDYSSSSSSVDSAPAADDSY